MVFFLEIICLKKIYDGAYVINLDEYSSVKWIELGHIFNNPKIQILKPFSFAVFSLKMLK